MKIRIPRIVGILNITEDSFSDGGQFLDPDRALKEALQLIEDGNDIVDIGAASSNPATKPVPPQVEMDRLRPVIDFLHSRHVPVSVDTFNPAVQKFALKNNVEYLNDIQGFPDATMYPVLADSDCKLIVMHSIQRLGPATVVETEPEQVWKGI
ncbi:MAG TPA: hypothetical protein DDW50_22335, partial [Firmicutes bacterium]|nr:hypothetical protein [Bacillota bacterium]